MIAEVLLPAAGVVSLFGHVWAFRSVRGLRGRLVEARRRSVTDPLTGLANRAGLSRALVELVDDSYDLVLVDLDRFKQVNDTWGHAAGDALLVEIARRLQAVVEDVDGAVVARLGGDELVVVCPSPAPLAQILGADVIAALAEPIEVGDGVMVTVRASVGAVHVTAGEDWSRALYAADAAAYEAKLRGGDGLVEHDVLTELPEAEPRPLLRLRELAALTSVVGVTA
ncbi:GGDEF domain-containing protein [Salinispora arenicola]|uniref:GGDEF domain-containing protein n=1 Tax=Salinispora arenicola TaxID=168697 RepID=UPI00037F84E3|nr:GGDEF domain-containing protein [Salinispora arenicola]